MSKSKEGRVQMETKTIGVLYLKEMGNPESAEVIFIQVDANRSRRNWIFQGVNKVLELGFDPREHFICCFDGDGNHYWLGSSSGAG